MRLPMLNWLVVTVYFNRFKFNTLSQKFVLLAWIENSIWEQALSWILNWKVSSPVTIIFLAIRYHNNRFFSWHISALLMYINALFSFILSFHFSTKKMSLSAEMTFWVLEWEKNALVFFFHKKSKRRLLSSILICRKRCVIHGVQLS